MRRPRRAVGGDADRAAPGAPGGDPVREPEHHSRPRHPHGPRVDPGQAGRTEARRLLLRARPVVRRGPGTARLPRRPAAGAGRPGRRADAAKDAPDAARPDAGRADMARRRGLRLVPAGPAGAARALARRRPAEPGRLELRDSSRRAPAHLEAARAPGKRVGHALPVRGPAGVPGGRGDVQPLHGHVPGVVVHPATDRRPPRGRRDSLPAGPHLHRYPSRARQGTPRPHRPGVRRRPR